MKNKTKTPKLDKYSLDFQLSPVSHSYHSNSADNAIEAKITKR